MTELRTARVAPEKAVFRPALPPRFMPGSCGADVVKMTYGEQLKHPNWQRKRLEALQAADFMCERCCDSESTLHVHHKHYVKGRMAWEYDLAELAVLCESCHEVEHEEASRRSMLLARLPLDGPWGIDRFVATGAGAVHPASDDVTQALMQSVSESEPRAFLAGAVAARLAWIPTADGKQIHLDGFVRLADLLVNHPDFIAEFINLLVRHGVAMRDSFE